MHAVVTQNSAVLAEVRDQVRFTREFMRRNEIVFQEGVQMIGAAGADVHRATEDVRRASDAMRESTREIVAELRDVRDESRAQREALLALIDEIRGGGLGPAQPE